MTKKLIFSIATAGLVLALASPAGAAGTHHRHKGQRAGATAARLCVVYGGREIPCGQVYKTRGRRSLAESDRSDRRLRRTLRSPGLRKLIATINWKLRRYVHPTGRCGAGEREQLATYYWQGRRTATGARFNPHGLTAAHRRLPFGTRLRVTNPHNGRSVVVRINDRGPYTIADIDLALGAARALGIRQSSYVCISNADTLARAEE